MLTTFYAGLLSLIFIKISLDTIKARVSNGILLGNGKNNEILALTSAHSNFTSYVPLFLILMYFYEKGPFTSELVLHAFGLSMFCARVLHYLGIRDAQRPELKFRRVGMHLTLWPIMILALANAFSLYTR